MAETREETDLSNMNRFIHTVAIDGPAASGKSTIGQVIADRLGYLYLDTGCMYRAVTLATIRQEIDVGDEEAVTKLAERIDLDIRPAGQAADGRHYTVLLGTEDITWDLRSPAVDRHVSRISSYLGVRQEMVRRQRAFGQRGKVIMVGRDIGTVVLPDAPLKLFITASAEERAARRWKDRRRQGHDTSYEAILADVQRRDKIDSSRIHSPLKPAEDALLLDTTGRSIAQVVNQVISLMRLPAVP